VLLRGALVVVCVAAIAFGVTRLDQFDSCQHTRTAVLSALFHRQVPAGGFAAQERRLVDTCRDRNILAEIAVVATAVGQPDRGASLARRAVRDEPHNVRGWAALARALDRSDPHGAAVARARVRALDPRSRVVR
jgi:hypothetical protein